MGSVIMSNSKNTSENLLSEQSQAWLNAWLGAPRYCHYFAVAIEGGDPNLMGDWNAPFYSIEEAKHFNDKMQAKYPDRTFIRIEGVLHIDGAMEDTPNKFWETWQNKHKNRIAELLEQLKGGDK